MKRIKKPSRKRDKSLQSAVTKARHIMRERVVPSKKTYKRKPKHKSDEN